MERRHYWFLPNWRVLGMSLIINMITIGAVVLVVPGLSLSPFSLRNLFILSLGLAILNTFIKPILQFLTIRLLFMSYGLVLLLMNAVILWLLSLILPDYFVISGVLAAIFGGVIISIVGSFLDYMLGVTPPLGYAQVLREEEGSI